LAQNSLFDTAKPDVMIIVREHSTGADLVQITMVKPNYPKELLQEQILKMGKELVIAPRGVQITTPNLGSKSTFLRAEFGIDGILEPQLPAIRLAPVIKAFAGAPDPHQISVINIVFDSITPTTSTVLTYTKDGVLRAEGRYHPYPKGIEYQIELLDQDPAKISFPEKIEKSNEKPPETTSEPRDNRVLLITFFSIAGLALGALVYFAMLRGGSRNSPKKKR